MPMVKWRVEPTAVLRLGTVDIRSKKAVSVDLADVTNCIFANIIRQLSCLCEHSQEMFLELEEMASVTVRRMNGLANRVNTLKDMASKLNPTVEEVSLDDIGAYKAFKSNTTKDPSFSPRRPTAVIATYHTCQPVPALNKLNQFRDDGKDGCKMYTNPEFFFELWCSQIKKEVNEKKPKRKKRGAQTHAAVTVRAPKNVRQEVLINKVQRQNEAPAVKPKPGQATSPSPEHKPPPSTSKDASPSEEKPPPIDRPPVVHRKPSTSSTSETSETPRAQPPGRSVSIRTSGCRPAGPPPPPPPPPPTGDDPSLPLPPPPPPFVPAPPPVNGHVSSDINQEEEADDVPPPPVMRTTRKAANRGTLYSVGDFSRETAFFPPPPPMMSDPVDISPTTAPPPPAPPPPCIPAAPPPPAGPILPTSESAFKLKAVTNVAPKRESRSDLLQAIRVGKTLRKVEETKTANEAKQPVGGGLFDVQTILEMRRKAMEEDSEEEEEDVGWDD